LPEQALEEIERAEPSLEQVRRRALRYADLEKTRSRGWSRRARLSGLLPTLTIRATRGAGWDSDLSRASSGTERLDTGSDGDVGYEARASWQLDRLLFDDAEIRSASTAQRLHRVRLQIGSEVTVAYYTRRKLQIQQLYAPAEDSAEEVMRQADIDALTGQLDALTGGWFSDQLGP
jgi:hypothetical protein